MSQRYSNRKKFVNRLKMYDEQLDARDVNLIKHYSTPDMTHPEKIDPRSFNNTTHIWKQGDRYYKLAHKYYGEAKLWWVIAWFNKKPTEAHLRMGDTISIPMPLETALSFLRTR